MLPTTLLTPVLPKALNCAYAKLAEFYMLFSILLMAIVMLASFAAAPFFIGSVLAANVICGTIAAAFVNVLFCMVANFK